MPYVRTQYNVVRLSNLSPYPAFFQLLTTWRFHLSYATFLFLYARLFSIYAPLHSTSAPLHSAYAASPRPVLRSAAGPGQGTGRRGCLPAPISFLLRPQTATDRPACQPCFIRSTPSAPSRSPSRNPFVCSVLPNQITRTAPVFIPSTPARFIPATLPPAPNSFGTGTRPPPQSIPRPPLPLPPSFALRQLARYVRRYCQPQQGREVPRRYSPATAFKSA